MLLNLLVENFVLLEKLELNFESGLCVMTGETGAGKSLIVDAIDAVTGGRLSPDQIKINSKSAYIEANFKLTEAVKKLLRDNAFDELDETITLSRSLQRSGSRCRINGQLTTLSFLRQVGELLIDTIGQHENQFLFKSERHKQIIDSLGDHEHKKLLEKVRDISLQLNLVSRQHEELLKDSQENKRQFDFYNFQLNEIDEADLKEGEEDELKNEREILIHAEELTDNLNQAYHELYSSDDFPSICDRLNSVSRLIESSAEYDCGLESLSVEIEGISSQLKDLSRIIREKSENIESDPEQLSELEERLDLISRMKNKYGSDVSEILKYCEDLRLKVRQVENSDEDLSRLAGQIENLRNEYSRYSSLLTESRKKIALELEPKVEKELSELGMDKTKFKVSFSGKKEQFSDNGVDSLEFLISPNPGEPLKSLSKTASGGECSRITLALKMVLYQINQVPTLIFDEIDTGISGKAALVVSQKLAKLAEYAQILCITHLPVVAAMAEQHLWIEKIALEDNTKVEINQLNENMRIEKLAQMSGGNINSASLKHAQDLYHNARDYKKENLKV